jgi:hypothetical protein
MPSRAVAEPICVDSTTIHETPTTTGGGGPGGPGSWTYTTTGITGEKFIRQIVVRSTSPTTTFDFEIIDANGVMIRQFLICTGVINDVTPTPVTDNFTVNLFNVIPNDTFEILIKVCSS